MNDHGSEDRTWGHTLNSLQKLRGTGVNKDPDDLFKDITHSRTKYIDLFNILHLANVRRALMRDDYRRIWNVVSKNNKAAVIYGQPGIGGSFCGAIVRCLNVKLAIFQGKSLSLYVTLVLRAMQRLPAAIQTWASRFLLIGPLAVHPL